MAEKALRFFGQVHQMYPEVDWILRVHDGRAISQQLNCDCMQCQSQLASWLPSGAGERVVRHAQLG